MVAADSQSIWGIVYQEETSNTHKIVAGVRSWELLMERIGRRDLVSIKRGNNIDDKKHQFSDEMLREWARTKLISDFQPRRGSLHPGMARAHSISVLPGTVLCASSSHPSPFLLRSQVFHQSLVLVIRDDLSSTVGVILNRPMASSVSLNLKDPTSIDVNSIPLRYGGRFGERGHSKKSTAFFHFGNPVLREARVGAPVGASSESNSSNGEGSSIWCCSKEDAETAVDMGIAVIDDFIAVEGVSVWKKQKLDGLWVEIEKGDFCVASASQLAETWEQLTKQSRLTVKNLDKNLKFANAAWALSRPPCDEQSLGTTRDLADAALKLWVQVVQLKLSPAS